jgi:FAD:protein FMN transferase
VKRRRFLEVLGGTLAGAMVPAGLRASATSASVFSRASATDEAFVERWSWAMGQPVHLQLFARSESAGYEAAQAALTELRRVEHLLSRFDDTSELSELNRRAGRAALKPGPDLLAALNAAAHYYRITDGAFDVAVEPLMRAWGFHAPRRSEPSAAEVAEARGEVRAAHIDLKEGHARLRTRATQLDLGGIGVGHGLDRAAAVLSAAGVRRALIDVSGDCLALDPPPGETGWRVGVADPDRPGATIGSTLLCRSALATSSNLVSVVRYGQVVRGHVMDPASGWPAERCRQVTVVADSGTAADALSTAALVNPKALALVRRSWVV